VTRYSFDTDGQRWHVGWDPAVASYFAQAEPAHATRDDVDELRDIVGFDRPGEVRTVTELVERLRGQVGIPDTIRQRLEADAPRDPACAAHTTAAHLDAAEHRHISRLYSAMYPAPAGSQPTTGPHPNGAQAPTRDGFSVEMHRLNDGREDR
jgi:hypothetical protein